MQINGTLLNYFTICHRKAWLFAKGISMEHTSDAVYEGKWIAETTYPQRAKKGIEIEIDGIKIDYYNGLLKIVHEVKKSNKMEEAHLWQVRYYLFVLKRKGVKGLSGILEYPKLRQRIKLELNAEDEAKLEEMIKAIETLLATPTCPPVINKPFCKNCSYYELCYTFE